MSLRINLERRGLQLGPAGKGDGAAPFDHTLSICYIRSQETPASRPDDHAISAVYK